MLGRIRSVRFSKPAYDPAKPDSLGRTDFAEPEYSFSVTGGLLTITWVGMCTGYPLVSVSHMVMDHPDVPKPPKETKGPEVFHAKRR